MNTRALLAFAPLAALAVVASGCPKDDELTSEEARDAVEETALASQASSLAEGSIELTTSFTLGAAVEEAAEEILGFVQTQVPCAEVTREGSTVSITYGANGDDCQWHGQSFSGTHRVTVTRNEENDVLVHHEWDEVSNGRVSVDGFADVTWDVSDESRHVVHELTWTRLSDGRSGTGSGDRLQSPLGGSWENGIVVDGDRQWEGERGKWTLGIDEVEWRWIDPLPQTGSYTAKNPAGKTLTLSFDRLDENTIHVTVEGARRDFEFNVTTFGDVE